MLNCREAERNSRLCSVEASVCVLDSACFLSQQRLLPVSALLSKPLPGAQDVLGRYLNTVQGRLAANMRGGCFRGALALTVLSLEQNFCSSFPFTLSVLPPFLFLFIPRKGVKKLHRSKTKSTIKKSCLKFFFY